MNELVIFSVAGAGMWALRASAIVLAGGRALPEPAIRSLVHAKHAVLAALIATAVAGSEGIAFATDAPSPQLLAAVAAIAVAWRTKGMLATLAAGVTVTAVAAAVGL